MRATTSAVISLLATGNYVRTDLWTITLNGGQVIRWTSSDQGPIKFGGNTWLKGPAIVRGTISEKLGPDAATLGVQIFALPTDLINGSPVIPFIAGHGLDGASVKLERAYAPDWSTMYGSGPVGTSIRFAGLVTSVNSVQGAIAAITISSWMILLGADMPRNLYQSACMHSLYDRGCTLNPASYESSGTVTTVVSLVNFLSSLEPGPTDYFTLGRVVFTSGPNNGVSRNVKSWPGTTGAGFLLNYPLPAFPLPGDTFAAFAGCDLTRATCQSKFNNLNNYKGTDFVPVPTTPLTIPASTTTTTSGKGGEQ